MAVSATKVVVISIFLILGMVLAGVLMQPEASLQAWDVKESSFPANESQKEKLAFLLNYAILAPSSHNSQPWKFNVTNDSILVFADESRWLQVADADKRELHISLGCALENLIMAADHFGYNSTVTYFPGEKDLAAIVRLVPASSSSADPRLFPAILSRQTNRNLYEPRAISDSDLESMKSISSDADNSIFVTSDLATKKSFQDLTTRANVIQYSDADFKSELGHWIGQGVMGPRGVQAIMAQLAVVFLDVGPEQTEKDAQLINSTPYLGFISTANNDSLSSVKAGRTLERFWLCATALGISLQPMSQALETAQIRENLSGLLPAQSSMKEVQQVFRLGYAKPAPEHSTRRPLADVMITDQ
ncbi:MAG: nitroreductase family protein [Methanothrix sp.]|nr:nitroreductase family protein [Methanothrix sp.]